MINLCLLSEDHAVLEHDVEVVGRGVDGVSAGRDLVSGGYCLDPGQTLPGLLLVIVRLDLWENSGQL